MQLFQPGAGWENAARHLQVFKLYGEWVAYQATDEELRQVVTEIQRLGLALAVEAGPLTARDGCGQGIEGFAGIQEGLHIARRIQQAGGVLHLLAMDEPYYFGHFYDGPNACRWTDKRIAQEIGGYIQGLRSLFPELIVGDTEPLAGKAGAPQYQAWMVAFRAVNGYDLAFLHLDIDWSRPNWPAEALSVEQFGRERRVPVGLIYTGNFTDADDEAWLSIAGERIKRYELEAGGNPQQVLFQSWHDKPDHLLPDTEPYTFTGLIRAYFEDKTLLGVRREGAGANLAYGKSVRYSNALPGYPGAQAVDGDPGTWWSAGDFKPQWFEIDLGQEYTIQSIRLLPSQSPAGQTIHRLLGRGEAAGAPFLTLHSFVGITQDMQPLAFTPDRPWLGIRYLRLETIDSPSWVAWREIEVIDAGSQE